MVTNINAAPVRMPEVQQEKVVPFRAQEQPENVSEEKEAVRQKEEAAPESKKQTEEISQKLLDEISNDIETLHSVGLNFSQHNSTGRTMVKVMNRDTDELIREIPAEKVLDMAAKIEEMIGLIFDQKV